MIRPPCIAKIRIRDKGCRFGCWLPLFLLFPLVLALFIIFVPFILIGAIVLWPWGWGKSLIMVWPVVYQCLCALRGLEVDVKGTKETVYISFP